ncbi:MBL fold metallo-hydrolase [Bacillus sp. CGMCC 1.16607]|uniref:MBL fold metallo-hydrolase n=1 Tax=Bacillus sp. CGMCC 1.16607 TaxID=3351842 RepID=UPI00362881BF
MKWFRLPLGPLQTNCYILVEDDGTCLIVDPGEEGSKLHQWLKEKKLSPQAILLTHAHFDHIGAVDYIRDAFQIPVYIHAKESKWLGDPYRNGSQSFMQPMIVKEADVVIHKEETLQIGLFNFSILETPGHSPGSVSYYFAQERIVVSGDALFHQSIGRTDLYGGNHEQLLQSIHKKLLTLPEDTLVLSGHGPETIIEDEMDLNPFLNGF